MRRLLVACLALLVVAAAGPVATASTKHAPKKLTCKRALKIHVRRLGKHERKRVLAVRRRCAKAHRAPAGVALPPFSTAQAPSGGAPAPSAPGDPAPAPDPGATVPPPPASDPHALQVTSGEYFLTLSKSQVTSGAVRVEFNNRFAEDPHDLHLVREDGTGPAYAFGELKAGELDARSLDLSKGTWDLFCALPEHAQRGMTATLKVADG
jgi:hypothetical protein